MWVRKTQLEIEEEKKIKESKRFKNALTDSAATAIIVLIILIIRAKIRGEGSVILNKGESLSWVEILNYLPFYLRIISFVFAAIFLYEFFSEKRIFKRETSSIYICDKCKKTKYKSTVTKCECGGTILNANEFKWIPDA